MVEAIFVNKRRAKMGFSQSLSAMFLMLGGLLTGCAPAQLTEGVAFTANQQGVREASAVPVRGMGHLRFDTALRSDLDAAMDTEQFGVAQSSAEKVLRNAHQLALRATTSELDRMPPTALRQLAERYDADIPPDSNPDAIRASLQKRYERESDAAFARNMTRVAGAEDPQQLHHMLADIRSRIEPEAGDAGRWGRVLLASPMYLPAAIGAELADSEATKRNTIAEFADVQVYTPAPPIDPAPTHDEGNAAPDALARRYAPVFVQEINRDAEYAPREDRIGRVTLAGDPGDLQVNIDVADPVVYWTRTSAWIHEQPHDQLVYVAWYPSRPALSPGDPQAGRIDGVVVRITLDQTKRPAIYEFVRTCGCYHTLWVADPIEQAALTEWGKPLPGMAFAVQKKSERNRELFMPALIHDTGPEPHRPVVMVNAGEHLVLTIDTREAGHYEHATAAPKTYRLEPYETLTHLPIGDQIASMFNSQGLVHGAARAEGWMLAPTGMLQAGRPRQLGTMKIRMDAYDYDDPRLLERNLRLPSNF
jgi:hypothetical protein